MAHATEAAHAPHDGHGHAGPHHGPAHYVKIWAVLCVLLVVSIIGPEFGIKLLTLITAFGIAIVKAWMVCAQFMHLNIEKKYVTLLLAAMVGVLFLFFYGIAPDVQKHEGTNWENVSQQEHIEKHLDGAGAGHGGDSHGAGGH